MNLYIELLLLAAIIVYIVDLSGFTQSWRGALEKALGIKAPNRLRALPPFDCSKCLVWWGALAWTVFVRHECSLLNVAYCAALSFGASILNDAACALKETVTNICNFIVNITTPKS